MSNSTRKLLLGISVLVIVIIISILVRNHYSTQHGNVVVNIDLATQPDIENVSLSFNNKAYFVPSLQDNYTLHDGTYKLDISKPGYNNFETSFSVSTNENLVINATMQISSTPPSINSSSLRIPGVPQSSIQITSINYFYDNSWAIVGLGINGGDNAILVAQYSATSKTWVIALGPGTTFSTISTQTLPLLVNQYLNNNGYINGSN
jgi:hypothetical protein